ncbi:uncharacterized protein LOC144441218 [Glandiceps talaboti]
MASNQTQVLEQLLQCPVCQRAFTRPVILPCFHLSCRGCVTIKNVKCAVCDQTFDLSATDRPLPSAHFIEHLVKRGSKTLQTKVFRLCQECESPAAHHCTDCNQFLCERCKKTHEKTKSHEIKTVEEYKRESRSPIPCPLHQDNDVEFMCSVCNVPICIDCTSTSKHKDHEHVTLAMGMESMMKSDKKLIDDVWVKVAEMGENLEILTNIKRELQERKHTNSEDIRDHVDTYLKAVWEAGQQLIAESNKAFDNSISVLSSKINEGGTVLEDLEGFTRLAEGLFEPGDNASRFFLARQCNDQMRKLLQKDVKVVADDIVKTDFAVNEDALISVSDNLLGSLEYSLVPVPRELESLITDTYMATEKDSPLTESPDENSAVESMATEKQPIAVDQQLENLEISANVLANENHIEEKDRNLTGDGATTITDTERVQQGIESNIIFERIPRANNNISMRRSLGAPIKMVEEKQAANDHNYYLPTARDRNSAKQQVREIEEMGVVDESAEFLEPHGIAVAPNRRVAIADTRNCEIKLFDEDRSFIRAFRIKRNMFIPGKFCPFDVAFVDNERLAVTDCENNSLVICNLLGKISKRIEDAALKKPRGVVVDQQRRVLVVDGHNHLVRVYELDSGDRIMSFGSDDGVSGGNLAEPWFIAVNSCNNILVSDSRKSCLMVYDEDGHFLHRSFIKSRHGQMRIDPCGICCDARGNICITRYDAGGVYAFGPDKSYIFEFGESWQSYYGIAVDCQPPWTAYVTDKVGNSVYVFQRVEEP